MPGQDDFHDLILKVRAGDQDAAAEPGEPIRVVHPAGCSAADAHRGDFRALQACDVGSIDVCQSVFKSLFARLKEGRFDLNQPQDMEKLLSSMIRFKIANKARRLSVIYREAVHVDGDVVAPGPGPEKSVDDRDLAESVLRLFSLEELELLNRRLDDQSWREIAAVLGGSPDALRKKLDRAFERIRDDPLLLGVITS